jgi:hypothetical protein
MMTATHELRYVKKVTAKQEGIAFRLTEKVLQQKWIDTIEGKEAWIDVPEVSEDAVT